MDAQISSILDNFAKRNWTLSLAESCTGGKVSATLTEKSGISKIFIGSVVSYSNSMKSEILGVSKNQLRTHGAVSEVVALAMAKGVSKLTKSTWAVSITGIAGPGGGSDKKPVGTVCFSLVGPGISKTYKKLFTGSRTEIQNSSLNFVLEILMERIAKDLKD